ncbi:PREDICTED: glutamyl-tRNA reductase-binding protein, chloroplastic [Tarenaya hassleriana]|uniref:glutamyl-tRNA reductase-binding protein, chloroplastic n=1 Tax=Tarenaya hassleriana TaxID=28532 RepID=UPI00053C6F34|nr:PREDICTED: glutamyl-tRNA reductase-binding protein, chloroplastic [Tarenaya hassleriana]
MQLQTQSLGLHLLPLPNLAKPTKGNRFDPPKRDLSRRISLRCSVSTASDSASTTTRNLSSSNRKPLSAEVSRTIMELSSVGTLSTLTHDGWPLAVGVRFAVDEDGTPVLCLHRTFSPDKRSALHVQLEQCGLRTPQCTIQGSIGRPGDDKVLKRLRSAWRKKFGEEVEGDNMYVVAVDRVLQMEDFMEDGVWVASTDYKSASPDPLRGVAEGIVNEINDNNMEDILRFCNVYVDLDFQVSKTGMIWMDRLGFDLRVWSLGGEAYDVRIPFPGEVTDGKGAKSSFNGMSQLAWEVEKSHYFPTGFDKVKQLKPVGRQITL